MKRWHKYKKDPVESPSVDAFLQEVIDVCKKHGMSISHEDSQGSFLVEKYSDDTAEWLMLADDAITP